MKPHCPDGAILNLYARAGQRGSDQARPHRGTTACFRGCLVDPSRRTRRPQLDRPSIRPARHPTRRSGRRSPTATHRRWRPSPRSRSSPAATSSKGRATQFRERWSPRWPGVRTYADYREMLAAEQTRHRGRRDAGPPPQGPVLAAIEHRREGHPLRQAALDLARGGRPDGRRDRSGGHGREHQLHPPLVPPGLGRGAADGARRRARAAVADRGPAGRPARDAVAQSHARSSTPELYLADAAPDWVWAELEPGFEDYGIGYAGDGGNDPATEPGVNYYVGLQERRPCLCHRDQGHARRPRCSSCLVGPKGRVVIDLLGMRLITVENTDVRTSAAGPSRSRPSTPRWTSPACRPPWQDLFRPGARGGPPEPTAVRPPDRRAHRGDPRVAGARQCPRDASTSCPSPPHNLPRQRRKGPCASRPIAAPTGAPRTAAVTGDARAPSGSIDLHDATGGTVPAGDLLALLEAGPAALAAAKAAAGGRRRGARLGRAARADGPPAQAAGRRRQLPGAHRGGRRHAGRQDHHRPQAVHQAVVVGAGAGQPRSRCPHVATPPTGSSSWASSSASAAGTSRSSRPSTTSLGYTVINDVSGRSMDWTSRAGTRPTGTCSSTGSTASGSTASRRGARGS